MSQTRRNQSLISPLLARILPKHYSTPTSEYALQKALKDITSRAFFTLERFGLHVMPKHFYTPVPDYRWLRENRAVWDKPNEMVGVRWDLEEQLEWLRMICGPSMDEVVGLGRFNRIAAEGYGPGYGQIESQVLHGFIRSLRPARVIEIGSGVSTAFMSEAVDLNLRDAAAATSITAIDPYPLNQVRRLNNVEIIPTFAQTVPIQEFDRLGDGDLLFIDSSHAVKIGSDVLRLFLEIIPKLKTGVYVHVHDINLPYLYPRTALRDYFGWQETALVLALLTDNIHLQPLASLSALHYAKQKQLLELFPDYVPQGNDAGLRCRDWVGKHFPDSLWLRTV